MDRIEFIEQLSEMIEKQTVVRDTLLKEKEVAYKNSVSYLRKVLEEPKAQLISSFNDISMSLNHNYLTNTEKKRTTTRVIILESHKLCKLEEECYTLQKEIDAYKSDAIDMKIPFFRKNDK